MMVKNVEKLIEAAKEALEEMEDYYYQRGFYIKDYPRLLSSNFKKRMANLERAINKLEDD